MQTRESRSFSEVAAELQASGEEFASFAKNYESEKGTFAEFAELLDKLTRILKDIDEEMDGESAKEAVESLEKDLTRVKHLIASTASRSPIKQMENLTQNLGRSLGLLLIASTDVSPEVKSKVAALYKELINAKFNVISSNSPSTVPGPRLSQESGFLSEANFESEIKEETISLGTEDVALQLKYGNDEEFRLALLGLNEFIQHQTMDTEWIDDGIIPVLFNRLGSSKPNSRLTIIRILRKLASDNTEIKDQMVDIDSLSLLVKSLTRDADERRESVGLLLELSDVSAVRRRIGRIQGCIVMLVSILNGDDLRAARDAGKLLTALSSNTQNALHMAEAGYFKPLVRYLKDGSDMSKILMATAVSRMELTDQSRASLGEDGGVEPLVEMFKAGKLESKLAALNALQNLSKLNQNIQRLVSSGIVVDLLQLLFSVTSVLMTLREPASAILARIAQSESILVNQDVTQQMFSLLSLSSPVVQLHLLEALNSIASHSRANKVRKKMKQNGAALVIVPFLTETNIKIRTAALNLLYTLSKDSTEELMEQLGDAHVNNIVNIVTSSVSECEKAAAIGILSNLPVSSKKATDLLTKCNLLPILIPIISELTSTKTTGWLVERILDIFIRFTVPSNRKLQLLSAELGMIPLLVKLLSVGSLGAKCRAAISLAQLSQSSLALRKSTKSRWTCMPSPGNAICEVHDGYCSIKRTFCLVKAGAVAPLLEILKGEGREADESVIGALATLVQDEIWESGSKYLAKMSAVEGIMKVLESKYVKGHEKALWILERIFRIEESRKQFGESAQVVLINLTQNGDPRLKSAVAKVLAQLELLQAQSSYF